MPCAIRWPGVIKPGTVSNDIFAHEDMLPTLLAAVGVPDVKEQLLKGMKVGDKTFKVHLDGYNITDALAGKGPNPRHEFFYFNDDGSLVALRYDNWKMTFQEQRSDGFDVWQEPFVPLRLPRICNLRSDPFEQAHENRHRLRRVANQPHVPARAGAATRWEVSRYVQGISAQPEGRQLQPRPGDGVSRLRHERQVTRAMAEGASFAASATNRFPGGQCVRRGILAPRAKER